MNEYDNYSPQQLDDIDFETLKANSGENGYAFISDDGSNHDMGGDDGKDEVHDNDDDGRTGGKSRWT